MLLSLSIGFFLLAALIGVYLITFVLQNKKTPKSLVVLHGPIAATGLLILIIYAVLHQPAPIISIILFILAAFGGFILFYKDITGKPIPKALAIAHGATALIAFALLLAFAFY